jgi:GT2 family glycosyltransferase
LQSPLAYVHDRIADLRGHGFVSRIEVVIPTYNNLAELRDCLGSLATAAVDLRAVVCVDGSTDGTQDHLRAATYPFPVHVVEHEDGQRHGRSATRNLALPSLEADNVLLLDSDMLLVGDSIERHIDLLARQRCVSVGSIRYVYARDNLWPRFLMTRGANRRRSGSTIRPLDFVTANSALRTADLLAVGGFDESFATYGGEDTQLALKLHERGVPFVFNEEAAATSVETKTVEEALAELKRYGATNLHTTRSRFPKGPAPYWIDRLESRRLGDRALRALQNRATDGVSDALVRIPWFALQRLALNYKVLRAVWSGYREGIE